VEDAAGMLPTAPETPGGGSILGAVPDNPAGRVAVARPSIADAAGSGITGSGMISVALPSIAGAPGKGITGSGMISVACESIGTSANGADDPPPP